MINIIEVSYKLNGKLNKREKTDYVVLHHTASKQASVSDIDKWHKDRGFTCIGYHFLVRKDGSVFRGRPIDTVGAHAKNYNDNSIGICAEGNFEEEIMSKEQEKSIVELIKYLKIQYPKIKIVKHKDLNITDCPGKNYPFDEIVALVNKKDNFYIVQEGDTLWEISKKVYKDANKYKELMKLNNLKTTTLKIGQKLKY